MAIAVGARSRGKQTRLATLNAVFIERSQTSFGGDLYCFHHGSIRKSRLNRQYHIDGMKRRRRFLKIHGGRVPYRKSVAAAYRSKTDNSGSVTLH
jgi:hypothetical protein